MWERQSLPIEAVFGASAHPPQAPIWLDPSGCPPGGGFRLAGFSDTSTQKMGHRTSRAPRARDRPHPAMPACGLTVDRKENPAFLRLSVDVPRRIELNARQRQSFPQNIPVTFD